MFFELHWTGKKRAVHRRRAAKLGIHKFLEALPLPAYRAALPRDTAIAELRANAGTQFDLAVVVAALKVLNRAAPDPEAVVPATLTPRPA